MGKLIFALIACLALVSAADAAERKPAAKEKASRKPTAARTGTKPAAALTSPGLELLSHRGGEFIFTDRHGNVEFEPAIYPGRR